MKIVQKCRKVLKIFLTLNFKKKKKLIFDNFRKNYFSKYYNIIKIIAITIIITATTTITNVIKIITGVVVIIIAKNALY